MRSHGRSPSPESAWPPAGPVRGGACPGPVPPAGRGRRWTSSSWPDVPSRRPPVVCFFFFRYQDRGSARGRLRAQPRPHGRNLPPPVEPFVWSLVHTPWAVIGIRSEEHTSELQSREKLVCRLLLEKKKKR